MIGFRIRSLSTFRLAVAATTAVAASIVAARFTWTSYVELFVVVDFILVLFGIVFNLSLKNG